MEKILISKENLEVILKSFVNDLYSKIEKIDLSETDKAKLEVLNHIVTNGDGTKFLADNGQYINIDINNINTLSDKINCVYELFKINGNNYEVELPQQIKEKITIIKNDGLGNKALTDDGTYKDLTSLVVNTLTDEEVNSLITEINSII